jgi:hypothetical protein
VTYIEDADHGRYTPPVKKIISQKKESQMGPKMRTSQKCGLLSALQEKSQLERGTDTQPKDHKKSKSYVEFLPKATLEEYEGRAPLS